MACLHGRVPPTEPVTDASLQQGRSFSPLLQRSCLGAQLRSPRGQATQLPRTVPLISLPCRQPLLAMPANQSPRSSPSLAMPTSFTSIDLNRDGFIGRREFEAAVHRDSLGRPGAAQSSSSQQVHNAAIVAPGGPLQSRTVSAPQNRPVSPACQRLVAEPVAPLQSPRKHEQSCLSPRLVAEVGRLASSPNSVQVPVESVQVPQALQACPQATSLLHSPLLSAASTVMVGADEDAKETLASNDPMACVRLRARTAYFGAMPEEGASASESTFVEEHGMTAQSGDDGWADDQVAGSSSPSHRLAQLEAEHEQLKNQVECKATLQDVEQMRQALRRLEADKCDISQSELDARMKADPQKPQEELSLIAADQDRLTIEHAAAQRRHEKETKEKLLVAEVQGKLVKPEQDSCGIIAGLRCEIEQLQQRLHERERRTESEEMQTLRRELENAQKKERRTESEEMQALRRELENAQKKGQSLEKQVEELKIFNELKLARLRKENESLRADLEALRKQNNDIPIREDVLHSAVRDETDRCGNLKQQIQKLERQLSAVQAHREQSTNIQRKLELQVEELSRQLQKGQRSVESLRSAVEEAQTGRDMSQEDASGATQKSHGGKRQLETTRGRKIEENDRELRSFRNARAAEGSTSSVAALQTPESGSEPIGSLGALQHQAVSQDVSHPFVVKVQETCSGLEIAIANADRVHLASLRSRFESAAACLEKGLSSASGFYDCELKPQIEAERQVAASGLESRMHDLIAIKEEAAVHHDLDESTAKKILLEHIDHDIARCDEELRLFEPFVPGEMPETVIGAILGCVDGQRLKECDGSFSPAHWAAEKGRRDLILYILQHAGGEAMLRSTDDMGRAPLFYAERSKRISLVHYLKSVLGAKIARPDVGVLPSAYKHALEQVESRGWHAIQWKDNFTMLHWAAGKGHEDLCAYLIRLSADPTAKDGQARTPSACAAAANHSRVAQLLEEASARAKSQGSLELTSQQMLSGA